MTELCREVVHIQNINRHSNKKKVQKNYTHSESFSRIITNRENHGNIY